MSTQEQFIEEMNNGYSFEGNKITLGGAVLNGECQKNTLVNVPLKMMTRHGLIAGATGSGKTKTVQVLAEQLSESGVPVLMMDLKGDLSGIAIAGEEHPKIDERHEQIGIDFKAGGSPVEFLTLSNAPGVKLRATVTEFGPILFSKMLELNETQSGIMAVIFKYSDDKDLALLDLKDIKKVIQHASDEGKAEIEKDYGKLSSASLGTILRKIVALEQQGAATFFGEPSFEVEDFLREEDGKGIISIVKLEDIQDKPKLFSTFMLQMLGEVYSTFPEQGDADKPKLVIFIDEAHLVFNEASKALLEQIEAMVKLIRSKGVGIFFVTQNPNDIPDAVLGQLGLKIQHALRAFTAKDRKAIKLAAQNYPDSAYYDTAALITELGIGQALFTTLNEEGIPTPLVHTLLRAPQSRMGVLSNLERDGLLSRSKILDKYNKDVDRESAYELLTAKLEEAQSVAHQDKMKDEKAKVSKATKKEKEEPSMIESAMNSSVGKTVVREVTRGLLGVLGIKSTRRRSTRRKNSWF